MEKISKLEETNISTTITKKGVDLKKLEFDEKGFIKKEENSQIKDKITCIRPSHKSGLPVVKSEFKKNKYISHNYCHSGIGYGLVFGTVNESIENLLKLKKDLHNNKNQEITVIGLGCMGLYTALKLHHMGYKNIKIIGEKYNETPSHHAGGLIELTLTTDYRYEDYLNKIFYETFIEYKKIYENKHEFLSKGIRYVDYFADQYKENMGLSYIAKKGLIPKINKVFFQSESNKNIKTALFHMKTFHVVTKDFMDDMMEKAKTFNIPIEFKKITNFEEINSEIIFNCTGLGSKELNNDMDCYPTVGHAIVLNDVEYSKYDYIFWMENVEKLKNNFDSINGPLYFMPKNTGFIGGSYVHNYDGENKETNELEISKLIKRAQFFFNDLKPISPTPKF